MRCCARWTVGPLEDILYAGADHYFDLIEAKAKQESKFRRCLIMEMRITGQGCARVKKLIHEKEVEAIERGEHPI